MDFFDNFIIIQKSPLYISNILILLFGALISFSVSGLFIKHSQKFSNIVTILSLLGAIIISVPAILGFLNTHGLSVLYYLNSKIILNGSAALYCLIVNASMTACFLISIKHLKALRHKAHYFNTLYLISALSANLAIVSNDFSTFILSLEALSLSSAFIICIVKNKNALFNSWKYYIFSLSGTAIMIFGFAASNGFKAQGGLLMLSQIIFFSGFLLKAGLGAYLAQIKQGAENYSLSTSVYLNLFLFGVYCILTLKLAPLAIQDGSTAQWLFIIVFMSALLVCALKTLRAQDFDTFISHINCTNFSLIVLCALTLNSLTIASAVFALVCILIAMCAILSAQAIFDINHKYKYKLCDFRGICHTNPFYCAALSASLLALCGILPSGILTSRMYLFSQMFQNGLWALIILALALIGFTLILVSVVNFIKIMHKRPLNIKNLSEIALKKRTNLNYFILFVSLTILIMMCCFSSPVINIITDFL